MDRISCNHEKTIFLGNGTSYLSDNDDDDLLAGFEMDLLLSMEISEISQMRYDRCHGRIHGSGNPVGLGQTLNVLRRVVDGCR